MRDWLYCSLLVVLCYLSYTLSLPSLQCQPLAVTIFVYYYSNHDVGYWWAELSIAFVNGLDKK